MTIYNELGLGMVRIEHLQAHDEVDQDIVNIDS